MSALRLGTRRSALALAQSGQIARRLEKLGHKVTVVEIVTEGDRTRGPLWSAGGKGLFVKAIDDALIEGRIDLAVHSAKDMTAEIPAGLGVAAVPARASAADVLVSRAGWTIALAPTGARIGTSSSRRAAQIRRQRPDLNIVGLRGNLDTRLKKISGEIDCAVLAQAGLGRLFLDGLPGGLIQATLDPRQFIPAPGQGCLALMTREDECGCVEPLNDADSRSALLIERAVVARLNADCHTPLGAYAWRDGREWKAVASISHPDGSAPASAELSGVDVESLGSALAGLLLANGGEKILEALKADAH